MQHTSFAPCPGMNKSQGRNSNMLMMISYIMTDGDNIQISRHAAWWMHQADDIVIAARFVRLSSFRDHVGVRMGSSDHSCTRSVFHHCAPNDETDNARPDLHTRLSSSMTMLANSPGSLLCICPRTVHLVACASRGGPTDVINSGPLHA